MSKKEAGIHIERPMGVPEDEAQQLRAFMSEYPDVSVSIDDVVMAQDATVPELTTALRQSLRRDAWRAFRRVLNQKGAQ